MFERVVVDANAGHVERVGRAVLHARRHLRVLALLARGRAVLEVHGDVEDAAHLLLELERLLDALLRPREVLAGRNHGHRRLALEERLVRMSGHENASLTLVLGYRRVREPVSALAA